jgi:hypothetical protein
MADVIYVGQSYITLIVNTGIDLAAASAVRVNYRKPSGVGGYWPATSVSGNSIYYDFDSGDLDESGLWSVQAYAEFDTGVAIGKSNKIRVLPVI